MLTAPLQTSLEERMRHTQLPTFTQSGRKGRIPTTRTGPSMQGHKLGNKRKQSKELGGKPRIQPRIQIPKQKVGEPLRDADALKGSLTWSICVKVSCFNPKVRARRFTEAEEKAGRTGTAVKRARCQPEILIVGSSGSFIETCCSIRCSLAVFLKLPKNNKLMSKNGGRDNTNYISCSTLRPCIFNISCCCLFSAPV